MTAFHFSRATLAVALTAACLATACGPAASGVPVLEVERQSTEFIVAAEGEVIASEALPIALPSDTWVPLPAGHSRMILSGRLASGERYRHRPGPSCIVARQTGPVPSTMSGITP